MKPQQLTKYRKAAHVACLALCASALTVPAISQTTPANPPTQQGDQSEITVLSPFLVDSSNDIGYYAQQTLIGSRSAKDILDINNDVAIIDPQMIKDFDVTRVGDILGYAASGVIQNQIGDAYDDSTIRGFRTHFSLRDGVAQPEYFSQNETYDVERVEVLKGPGTMMLGDDSFLGGAINYITRKPTANPQGEVSVTVGDYGYIRGMLNMSGPINKSKDFTVLYRVTAGAINGPSNNADDFQKDHFIGGALTMTFGQNTTLNVEGSAFYSSTYNYWQGLLLGTPPRTDLGSGMSFLDPYEKLSTAVTTAKSVIGNEAKTYTLDATLTQRLTENANLRFFIEYQLYDFPNEQQTYFDYYDPSAPYNVGRYDNYEYYYNQTTAMYVDYLHTLKTKYVVNDFQAGADYKIFYNQEAGGAAQVPGLIDLRKPDYSNDATLYAQSGAYPDASLYPVYPHLPSDLQYNVYSLSYYIEDRIHLLNDAVQLIGGVRWYSDKELDEDINAGVTADNSKPPTRDWKMGIVIKPWPGFSLYADHTVNTIPLSGYIINYNPDGTIAQVIPYKNQQGILTEVGAKANHRFNDTFSVYGTVAYFDMSVTNVRTFAPNSFVYQSGLTTSKGYDIDLGSQIKAGPGAFDVLFTYEKDDTFDASTGRVAVSTAPWAWSVVGKYTVTSGILKGAMIGTGWKDEGKRLQRSFYIDNPVVGTAFIGYQLGRHWGFQVNVENVTNQEYLVVAANGGPWGIAQIARPRTEEFTATYRW